MNEVNPYASPRSDVSGPPPETGADEPSAWRDGEVLVARRRGAVLPRACPKSNRSRRLGRLNLMTLPWGWEVVCLAIELSTPFLGTLLYPTIAGRLIRSGRASSVPIRTRVGRVVICWALGISMGVLIFIGDVLKVVALVQGSIWTFLLGALLCGASYLPGAHLEALLLGFRTELADPDLVRVRGVHPDYLARLPEYVPPRPPSPLDDAESD